jgi:Ras-related protein Rab-21
MYYRGASVALLVFDVTSEQSFLKVKEWVKELRTNVIDEIIIAVVGNQIDRNYRKIEKNEGIEYAQSIGGLYFETSAKDNQGIEEMFIDIAKKLVILNTMKNSSSQPKFIEINHEKQQENNCC